MSEEPKPEQTPYTKVFGLPPNAGEHFRQARIEILKGIRSLLDNRIEALAQKTHKSGTHITVE